MLLIVHDGIECCTSLEQAVCLVKSFITACCISASTTLVWQHGFSPMLVSVKCTQVNGQVSGANGSAAALAGADSNANSC